ncbi:hypothetical protein KJ959_04740 [bacterium]|nr:hypothetical protein [Candidatus Omnitrophota bacterium]MBU3930711.1 hypothetical protein [bacterium]MBU4122968.1 hypothetical protein [bacterium]
MGEKIKTEMEDAGERLKEFYEKAKVFTKDVSGRISKQAGIQKLNIDALKLNDKLEASYRELGEKSFAYFRKNPPADAEIKKLIAGIKSQNTAIKSLKAKISRQKKS